jgi:hypothetical protein
MQLCTYFIMYYYVVIICHSGTSWCQVVNSFLIFFTQSASTFNLLFQNIYLKVICTNWLALSCHYDAFCFFLNVSQLHPSVLLLSSSLVTGFLSSLVILLLSQCWTPPLRLQVSACSTFLIMCDIPSLAVFFVGNLLSVVLVLFQIFFL